ncbi:glycine-rich domain-containing protein 2 isoform X2 [Gastrolobium bilobum]|uniref:glycine-rich domain-containing protein 2 isoform X2 n=1 Tax=Gastrolobium bilobum TaxID=150636 RepID=UPI002AB241BC|nr:glycine-rich domain-containing protein 2 isoform X2 [Gastrolobium bilobum]
MSEILDGSKSSASKSSRSLGELPEIAAVRVGIDLVSAARRNIGFLRSVAYSEWLHHTPIVVEAIRRYHDLWMPLISDLTVPESIPLMILPPFDVEWVWFCHTLNPVSYREYCETRFSKLIGRAAIFDEENREYALMRCREIWSSKYPLESFENEASLDSRDSDPMIVGGSEDVFKEVEKQRLLCSKFAEPYRSEVVYLISARQRYKAFLYMLQRFAHESSSRLVPTSDILLMWLTHQSYPTVYVEDLKALALDGDVQKVATLSETVKEKEFEETKKLWDRAFNQPYEKAGGEVPLTWEGVISVKSPIYWEESDTDVNTKYRSMIPRFLLEVCVFVRLKPGTKALQKDINRDFLRLRIKRCHSELKLDKSLSNFPFDSWKKAWHLYCEFGTKGVMLEYRRHGGNCLKGSKLQDTVSFRWNDLLRADSLTLEKEVSQQVNVVTSITPPVQAPYLLKCVPDRVTDDSGAMISDVILKMNSYHPQEGRWLSRTVLDHAGKVCFVIRIRIGGGFWRRGGETPSAVKWEDRIIEIREGSWYYVAGSIGRAPEKVVATATPKEPAEQWEAAWCFSTGDELIIQWESSLSVSGLTFSLRNQSSQESSVKLLKGRQMQYQIEEEEDEEGFLTLVRFTEDDPVGKATALLNWRLLVVEVLPEEDAVLMLLLCITILKSVSEMRKQDLGGLLVRRRLKEARLGTRDWGSVILHPSSWSSSIDTTYLQPWYCNAGTVMSYDEIDQLKRQPPLSQSPVEGSDKLYKHGIIS